MSGSIFGTMFCVSTFGESHGPALGAVVDGCPAGVPLSQEYIQAALDRRKPGDSPYTTPRKEADQVEILSGVFDGRTTGAPVALLVRNTNARSADYDPSPYRPGHADLTFDLKYGFRDHRGGGRSSGRETAARVAAGAVAQAFLAELGVDVYAYTCAIGGVAVGQVDKSVTNALNMPDAAAFEAAACKVQAAMAAGDSLGGEIVGEITGLPPGVGEPVFRKFSAVLGQALLSIGGVKGVDFGAGFAVANVTGHENNDALFPGTPFRKDTNHAGGMYGGITDGSPVTFRLAVKPTPSIAKAQHSINQQGEAISLSVGGRHDPLIVPRAVPVAQAMAALATADLLLQSLASNMDNIRKIFT